MKKIMPLLCSFLLFAQFLLSQTFEDPNRPLIHFTPKEHWMNDPNGMVFYNGVYHLFFQYYPGASVWGPMHWGHATSKDLVNWEEQPIALYPDKLGYIFSGSAVVDKNNTSGFGSAKKPPLIAIFTQHDTAGERAHTKTFQNQSIAYSTNGGKTWVKYKNNPVLKNPGDEDFRDPKVMWYAEGNEWMMTLAVKDHVEFYSSPNLKDWTKQGEFGRGIGAHGGVWECPDLISFDDNGKTVWVLIVSINPGGPNGGSATQYFVGNFDGKTFTPFNDKIKWIDYGPDDYAGVTWSNTGDRKIFLGWMSNWAYGQLVPTSEWRGAMTIPRNLSLVHVGDEIYVTSKPVVELNVLTGKAQAIPNLIVYKQYDLTPELVNAPRSFKLDFTVKDAKSFAVKLSNEKNERLLVGYNEAKKEFYINRGATGNADFQQDFAKERSAPRISTADNIHITLVADASSVELFADDGLTVMTEIFFPTSPFDLIQLTSNEPVTINNLIYSPLKPMQK